MYYCTIYMQPKGRVTDKSLYEVFISLAYTDKVDAENYKNILIQQTVEMGGKIFLEEDDYTTVTGDILIKSTGVFKHRGKNRYKIGVETEATKFSVLPFKAKASVPGYKITDGLAFEVRVAEVKQRKLDDIKAKQDEAINNLASFKAEIKPMTEFYQVLRAFIKYANKRTDKEKLADIVLKKIKELQL